MKKLLFLIGLLLSPMMSFAQCELPQAFYGNTGGNMTVMLTSSFINSIPISDPNAYVVALNEDGLVVGSQLVFDRTQATIAIWGDDSDTPEKDGASFGETITFQLYNGSDLYLFTFNYSFHYSYNRILIHNAL